MSRLKPNLKFSRLHKRLRRVGREFFFPKSSGWNRIKNIGKYTKVVDCHPQILRTHSNRLINSVFPGGRRKK